MRIITHFLPSGVVNSFQTVDASALCYSEKFIRQGGEAKDKFFKE